MTGNKVSCKVDTIYPNTKEVLPSIALDGKSFELEYGLDKNDFWYPVKLMTTGNRTVFYARGNYATNDNGYTLGGYEVYKYDGGEYYGNGKLNVRDKPSTGGKKLFLLNDRAKIRVAGKTKQEDTIDGIQAPWYFVDYKYEERKCPA